MFVWRGVDPTTYDRIDSGLVRRAADALIGVPDPALVSAAARQCIAYETIPPQNVWAPRVTSYDNDQISEWVSKHPEIGDVAALVRPLRREVPATLSSAACAMWIIQGASPDREAEPFWQGVATGADLGKNDARLALRKWLTNRQTGKGIRDRQTEVAVWIKAWNRWLAGGDVLFMTWRPSEGMPRPTTPADTNG